MSDSRAASLAQLLEQVAEDAPGVLLGIEAPLAGFRWRGAAGPASLEGGDRLAVDDGFRIASMSKTFTGVLASQLAEEGAVDLATPTVELLPADLAARLHQAAPDHVDRITTELLLHHRAGFSDFALSEPWFEELASDPGRFRAPADIAAWALENGEVLAAPDERYHYSDTGYVLVGMTLESVTGQPYWQLCRERIFDRLSMDHTWLEGHEEPRSSLSHCYLTMNGAPVDALQVHGSCDWAAGGHVSTLEDLDRFLQGLFNGGLFGKPATLDAMLIGLEAKPGYFYGRGIGRKQLAGKHLWGHLGHWGSFMYFCPEERLRVAGTLNVDREAQNDFLASVLEAVFD